MGSGALPLLAVPEFRQVAAHLAAGAGCVTNNFFSADLTAWTPGEAIERAGDFSRDNVLPRRLRDHAGLPVAVLDRTPATTLDLDTPSDLAVLHLCEGLSPALAAATAPAAALAGRYRALFPLVCDRTAEIVVAGRVGSQAWQYLERETACRVRLFSEERGLASAGPGHRPRSLLGFFIEETGSARFFERMALLGDALVLDARVIEAHLGVTPSREDRFQSDLFNSGAIRDVFLREFTEAAAAAPKPVLLGGHSLVAGGLMALNDAAWAEHDRHLSAANRTR
jgi:hypothetical protein